MPGSRKNETKLFENFSRHNPDPPAVERQNIGKTVNSRRGRKLREDRPSRAAAKRTKPGEEKYRVALTIDDIAEMKVLALMQAIPIKEAYAQAIADYRKKWKK